MSLEERPIGRKHREGSVIAHKHHILEVRRLIKAFVGWSSEVVGNDQDCIGRQHGNKKAGSANPRAPSK
jgi:hypothetical protein